MIIIFGIAHDTYRLRSGEVFHEGIEVPVLIIESRNLVVVAFHLDRIGRISRKSRHKSFHNLDSLTIDMDRG